MNSEETKPAAATATTEPYAEFWLRGLAAVLEALVFMAISIPVAFGMPFFITRIDASLVLPEIPGFFFIEGLVPCIAVPFFAMTIKQHLEASHLVGPTESSTIIWVFTIGGLCVTNLLYHVLMEASPLQGTVGKLVVGMRVTNKDGGRPSFFAALVRHLARLLSMLPLFLGYFMVLRSAKRQALHDKLSGCLVIKTETPAS